MQERPQPGEKALQGLGGYQKMVDSFAEQAKTFWRSWGPTGEPMVQSTRPGRRCNALIYSGLGKPTKQGVRRHRVLNVVP